MTITLKSQHIGKTYIEILQDKYSVLYDVSAYREGKTINTNSYTTIDKAKKRFYVLTSKVRKGIL